MINKNKGFSLVELMVSLAISGMTGVIFLQFVQDNEQLIRDADNYSQMDFYTSLGGSVLSKEDACGASLGSLNLTGNNSTEYSDFNILTGDGNLILEDNQVYGARSGVGGTETSQTLKLQISLVEVEKTRAGVGSETQNNFVGKVRLNWSTLGGTTGKAISQDRFINVFGSYDPDNNDNIISCSSDFKSSTDEAMLAFCENFLNRMRELSRNGSNDPNNETPNNDPEAYSDFNPQLNPGTDPTTCLDLWSQNNFRELKKRLRDRVCVNMGGIPNGDENCSFNYNKPIMNCPSGTLRGFSSTGQAQCQNIIIPGGGSAPTSCNVQASLRKWGSTCAGSPKAQTIKNGERVTIKNTVDTDNQAGELLLLCDNGNIKEESSSCYSTQCKSETIFWGDDNNCSHTVGAGKHGTSYTNDNRFTNSAEGFDGAVDLICSNGQWTQSNPVCNPSGIACSGVPNLRSTNSTGSGAEACKARAYKSIDLNHGEKQSIFVTGSCEEVAYGNCERKSAVYGDILIECIDGKFTYQGEDLRNLRSMPLSGDRGYECNNDCNGRGRDACGICFDSNKCTQNYCQGEEQVWGEAGGPCK